MLTTPSKRAATPDVANRHDHLSTLLLFLALLCYFLPWWWSAAAGLTAHAFDLAEFIGLAPAVRGGSPPMLAPFLLRLPLAILALLFMLRSKQIRGWTRWLPRAVAVLLTLTLIPPIEFIRVPGATDDPNYRQLFALLVGTGAALVIALVLPRRPGRVVSILLALIAAGAAVAGTWQAFEVIVTLGLTPTVGAGVIGMVGSLLIFAALVFRGSDLKEI